MASTITNQASTGASATTASPSTQTPATATRDIRQVEAQQTAGSVDPKLLRALYEHPATRDLETRLGYDLDTVYEKLISYEMPYDFICVLSIDAKSGGISKENNRYYTSADMQGLLYSYFFKRTTAITLAVAEGCHLAGYQSKTDAAFVKVFRELISRPDMSTITNVPSECKTMTIESIALIKAVSILTKLPIKFSVESEQPGTLPKRVVAFWFEDVEPKGCWNTTWEYMSEVEASRVCPDEDYEL